VPAPPAPGRLRWFIVALLVGFSLVSYVDRINISIASKLMIPELGLTQVQMGQIFSAFLLGYALLQIPIGMLADRVGPSRILRILGWLWAALTVLTAYLPGSALGALISPFALLVVLRFTLGTSIAGIYPLCARTVANWMPVAERAFAYSFVIAGVSIGSAVTPPVVAWAMTALGWRTSFYLTAVPPILMALLWARYGDDGPRQHPTITPAERDFIISGQTEDSTTPATAASWLAILSSPSLLLLSISYFCIGYVLYVFVFWFFTYLTDVRKFSIVGSGFFTSLPFVVAFVLSPVGGAVCDRLTSRLGRRQGRRLTAIAGILAAAACLGIGVRTEDAYIAVAALSLAFGFQMFSESAYWSATMDIAGRGTGAATGLINSLNNLGGVVSTALTPVLIERFGWNVAFGACIAVSVVAAALWLGIRADRTLLLPSPTPGPLSAQSDRLARSAT
jgi:ACS family glucarate transporter-like MFS transporter